MDDKQLATVAATVAALGTGFLMKKALESTWQRFTGHVPPANPDSDETSWGEALAWASVSGALLGVARLIGRRAAVRSVAKATGRRVGGSVEPKPTV